MNKLLSIIIGIVGFVLIEIILRNFVLPDNPGNLQIGLILIAEWALLLILLFYWIPRVEKSSLKSIGIGKFKIKYLGVGLLTYIGLIFVWMGSSYLLHLAGLESLRDLDMGSYSYLVLFGLFITGTLLEEIYYRGYLIEKLILLTQNKWIAAIVSIVLFIVVHVKFFGWGPALEVGVISIALALIYLKYRNIWPCIILHGINNLLAFIIFPLFIK